MGKSLCDNGRITIVMDREFSHAKPSNKKANIYGKIYRKSSPAIDNRPVSEATVLQPRSFVKSARGRV